MRRFLFIPVLAIILAFSFLGGRSAHAAVINEVGRWGTSPYYYVEFYGSPGESLDSLTYVVIGNIGANQGVIRNASSLPGQSFAADDNYFVMTSTQYSGTLADYKTTLTLWSETHLLVENFSGALNDDLDTDDDGILDITPWTSVVDSFSCSNSTGYAYSTAIIPYHLDEYAPAYRTPDGADLWESVKNRGTPGSANHLPNQVPTDVYLSNNHIPESSYRPYYVGALYTTDSDLVDGFTYELLDDADGHFYLSSNIYIYLNIADLDYETTTSYTIRVKTTDYMGEFLEKDLTIHITDVNETPTDIALSASTIAENSANDTIVGTLSTTDPETGQTHTYTLRDDAGGRFKIVGDEIQVADSSLLNYEVATSHDITVRSTDSGSPALSFDKTFTITVTDVNDAPSDITLSGSTVVDTAANGTVIGTLGATDDDAGQSVIYALTDDAGGRFSLSGNELQVADASLLEYHDATSHDITVRVTDDGIPPLYYDKTLTINVLDGSPPSVTVEQATGQADPALALPILFDVLFSKNVVDFTTEAVTMNGTAVVDSMEITGSGKVYQIVITAVSQDGTIEPMIAADLIHDEMDMLNLESTSVDNSITLDSTAPLGTVVINAGAAFTTQTQVDLALATVPDGDAAEMRISNDEVTWSDWQAFAVSLSWDLAAGDGLKTVYVQYRDALGNASANFTDTITLDTTGPVGTIAINGNDVWTSVTAVTLTLGADDGTGSGVASVRLSNDGTNWTEYQEYAATLPWTIESGEGDHIVHAQYRDALGNESDVVTSSITLDTTPTGGLTVAIGPAEAVTDGAQWSIDGGSTWLDSGATESDLAVGDYTVQFKDVTRWTTPANQTVTVTRGDTVSATGVYVIVQGTLTVTIDPAEAVSAGAQWRRAGTYTWLDSGATTMGLTAGNIMIEFKRVNGWAKPNNQFVTIADGEASTASGSYVASTGSVIAWGSDTYGQCNVPSPNLDFVQISSGNYHSVGLKADGSIVTWGMNENGQCDVPEPNSGFIAVDAGTRHTLGLKSDGSIVAWGLNDAGQCNVPEPNSGFVAVAGGYKHSIALKDDGTIVEWGNHLSSNLIALTNNHGFVDIRAGYDHSLALRTDGSIAAWGYNGYQECAIPAPNSGFLAIGVGVIHSFGLKADGRVVAWGYNVEGQCNVPTPNSGYQAISGGRFHSIGLKTDGSLVAWGTNTYGQRDVPTPNSGFVAIEAGYIHNAAIKPGLGALTVNIQPQEAADAGAQWSVDGGTTWRASGYELPLDPGDYTVMFKDIRNWTTPDTQAVSVVADQIASISVNMEILPTFGCDTSSLSTTCDEGQTVPDQTIHVWNSEGGELNYAIAVSPAEATWLSVSPESGTSTGESDPITVSYDTTGLAAGIYKGTITISDPDALNSPVEISVVLSVGLNKILAGDGGALDAFGSPISISGNTAVIGAINDCPDGYEDTRFGSAYIFIYSDGVWTQQAKLVSPQPRAYEHFGNSVSISGDTVIIGTGDNPGYAYIYHRINGIWTLQAQLSADEGADQYQFGISVSIFGDTAVVGSNLDDDFGESSGAAYVFTHTDGVWTKEAKLTASDATAADNFGWSVSISGDEIIAGSSWNDDAGSNSGSAYIFTRSNGIWTQQAKLTSSDAEAGDGFGDAVLISDDTVLIDASGDDDGGGLSGSVYFYARIGGIWTQQAKMITANPGAKDYFGSTMAISGDMAIIGAQLNDDVMKNTGSAYVYTRSDGVWAFKEKLMSPVPVSEGLFGASVAIENSTALICEGPYRKLGAVYVFTLDYDPPTVTITEPTSEANWTTTEGSLISLVGTASDIGSGLASITWTNDRGGSGTATGTENWSMSDIPLQIGDNIITVTATDVKGLQSTDVLTVTLPPASISVSITPAEAVSSGAQWSIDGGTTWQTSGDLISDLSAGDYHIQFKTLDGWLLPESQVVSVGYGQTAEISLNYSHTPLDASVVWVDFNYTGEEWGSEAQPYNTLAEGVMAVASGGTIRIKTGASGTTTRITTPMRIEASGGPVTIGQGTISGNRVNEPDANAKGIIKITGDPFNQKSAAIEWIIYE